MRKLPILTVLIFSSCLFLHAQTDPSSRCPSISVDGPTRIVAPGEITTFSARITNVNRSKNLKYSWSSSAGEIIRGQGTTTISVRQPTLEITVTVEIRGLPDGCPNLASETENWGDRPPQALKLGETSDLRSMSAGALLERVVQVIKDYPNAQLFILSGHISGKTSADVSTKEQELLRDLSDKGIDRNQISVIGVFAELELFQFWLVPPGADRPRCRECEELEKRAKETVCPNISVDGPAGIIEPGGTATFIADVAAKHSAEGTDRHLTYDWSVDRGTIASGQGTPRILVIAPSGTTETQLLAAVKVGGLPQGCPDKASQSADVARGPECGLPADEYGRIPFNEERWHLDNDATFLEQNPRIVMSIILFLEPTETRSSGIRRLSRIRSQMVNVRKADPSRIRFYFAEGEKTSTSFYLTTPDTSDAPRKAFDAKAKIGDLRPKPRSTK